MWTYGAFLVLRCACPSLRPGPDFRGLPTDLAPARQQHPSPEKAWISASFALIRSQSLLHWPTGPHSAEAAQC